MLRIRPTSTPACLPFARSCETETTGQLLKIIDCFEDDIDHFLSCKAASLLNRITILNNRDNAIIQSAHAAFGWRRCLYLETTSQTATAPDRADAYPRRASCCIRCSEFSNARRLILDSILNTDHRAMDRKIRSLTPASLVCKTNPPNWWSCRQSHHIP